MYLGKWESNSIFISNTKLYICYFIIVTLYLLRLLLGRGNYPVGYKLPVLEDARIYLYKSTVNHIEKGIPAKDVLSNCCKCRFRGN